MYRAVLTVASGCFMTLSKFPSSDMCLKTKCQLSREVLGEVDGQPCPRIDANKVAFLARVSGKFIEHGEQDALTDSGRKAKVVSVKPHELPVPCLPIFDDACESRHDGSLLA